MGKEYFCEGCVNVKVLNRIDKKTDSKFSISICNLACKPHIFNGIESCVYYAVKYKE